MNPPGHGRPHPRVALRERLHFIARQLESQLLQLREGFERPLDESGAQLFFGEQTADHELNGFLRHAPCSAICAPTAGTFGRARTPLSRARR